MNKTILLIANTTGCLYNFRHGLIKKLLTDGYNVHVLAPYFSQEAYSEKAVTELKSWGVTCDDIQINSKGMNPVQDLKLVNTYVREFKRIKPDVILSYTIKSNIYGSVAARKVGLPIICNVTGLGNLYSNPNMLTKVANSLYKWGFKKSHTVFFQNQDDMDLFVKEGNVKLEQCGRIPGSGINIELFKPEPKKEITTNLKFLMIARLIWDKGVEYYIDAIKIIKPNYPHVEFQILGERGVNNPSAIPDETVDLWINSGLINYLGTSNNVRDQIRECDCMVLPSIYREGVPRTLIEGSAMGKPIITTDNVGCRDIVKDGYNGYLCNKRDSKDLAQKIEKFINLTNEQRVELSNNGREKAVTEFNEEIVIKKYLDKIENIVGLKG